MPRLLVLLVLILVARAIYKNAKVDPHYTRLDGWESTARNRRTDIPPSPLEDA